MAELASDPLTAEPGPTEVIDAANPLELLLVVQDFDTSIAQLEHRIVHLVERDELDRVIAALTTVASSETSLAAMRGEIVEKIADCERQVTSISGRSRSLQERMFNDRGSSTRDLQAMDEEIQQLSRRRSAIEEVELGLMEEQEPIDVELSTTTNEREQLETAAGSLRMAITAAEAVVLAEITSAQGLRAAAADRLPATLLERYETLRSHFGGVGAARLIGNHCEGCHLELSSVEVEQLHHQEPGTISTCDQCGRILIFSRSTPRSTSKSSS